jgi:hypothetical protein
MNNILPYEDTIRTPRVKHWRLSNKKFVHSQCRSAFQMKQPRKKAITLDCVVFPGVCPNETPCVECGKPLWNTNSDPAAY